MEITTTSRWDKPSLTTLVGRIRDQAELSGVLDTLHGMHLPIVKIERIEDEGESQ